MPIMNREQMLESMRAKAAQAADLVARADANGRVAEPEQERDDAGRFAPTSADPSGVVDFAGSADQGARHPAKPEPTITDLERAGQFDVTTRLKSEQVRRLFDRTGDDGNPAA